MSIHWTRRVAVTATLAAATATAGAATTSRAAEAATIVPGYWMVAADGGVYGYGAPQFGSARGIALQKPIVAMAPTPDGQGYWLVASDGGIFSYGDAGFFGSAGNIRLNQPIVGIAPTSDGKGYWLVARDGGIFSYGDAGFYGSAGNIRLNQPIVGIAPTSDGKGYWLVASDGGIFAYGSAPFYGSAGNIRLARPIVGIATTPGGGGYWMVASDGGIFAYGNAGFFGSAGNIRLSQPVVGMSATADGRGYWLAARDGGLFAYGDAGFEGSAATAQSPAPIVGMVATTHGVHTPGPGATGYDVSQWQCSASLPAARNFAVVQVTAGAINAGPNPCYHQEAAWAGSVLEAYIFADGLPSPAPSESLTGPAGTCNGDLACEGYNFGYHWAAHWIDYSAGQGYTPPVWWVDVETSGSWPADTSTNGAVVRGALAGLRSRGVTAGVYSTGYQFPRIAGSTSLTGVPEWVAGADYLAGDSYSATAFCANSGYAFNGGTVRMVQYGYTTSGPAVTIDPDYACP